MTDRISRTMHQNAFQLTRRYDPLLCTAVLLDVDAQIGVTSAAPRHSKRTGLQPTMPSPSGQISGIADRKCKVCWVGTDSVGHPRIRSRNIRPRIRFWLAGMQPVRVLDRRVS